MNIGIDIDDTISYTFEETYPAAKKFVENDLGRKVVNEDFSTTVDYNYIENVLQISQEEMEEFWRKNLADLTKKVKPKENSVEVINKLKEEGHNIIIITARWNEDYCDSEKLTKEWLKKYNISYDKLYIGAESKKQIAIDEKLDLFIDDSIKNCEEVSSANIESYLFASKINIKNPKSQNFNILYTWDEEKEKINSRKGDA